jgi:hypothetical protein
MGLKRNAAAARGTAHKKRSPADRVQRFVRKLLGMPRAASKPPERPGEDEVFEHLWRTATAASAHRRRFSIHQRNVLLFQMGKVASIALEGALFDRGLNCFHCHQLAQEGEAQRLKLLFEAQPALSQAAIELKLLTKHTALNMLVRWYRRNQVAPERKLKVITLTRDPAARFASSLMQRYGYQPHRLVDWHRNFPGASEVGQVGAAAGALLRQVAALTLQARPSLDLAAARARGTEMAMAMTPPQPFLAESFHIALDPLDWFDRQFRPMFGIDLRALPELAEHGLAERTLDFADVLVVRFEDLSRHVDAIGRFVGLPAFEVPAQNASADKAYGNQLQAAARSFWASELGSAFQRELRQGEYGRLCGYDRQVELDKVVRPVVGSDQ